MATSYGALCTDFFINQKLALKLDLPTERETVLHFFDQLRKADPSLARFRRYDGEFALESANKQAEQKWVALRRTSIRSGHVNPESLGNARSFHELVLKVAPYHLTASPLDIDYVELMFGFDLECGGDQDEVVHQALFTETPMGGLLDVPGAKALDVQPIFGMNLSESGDLQAYFEVKTREKSRRGSSKAHRGDPLSIYLTVRKYGPMLKLDDLMPVNEELFRWADTLTSERLIPCLLQPITQFITPSSK